MRVACLRSANVLVFALALAGLNAQPAAATFHEMMIREVYPGSAAHPNSEYVELQMWSAGQNFVGGHSIGVYDPLGVPVGNAAFAQDVNGDANQSTLVLATPEAESELGFVADAGLAPGLLNPAGGAVCWETLDCVAWGSFSGPTKSPVGQPAAGGGIPDGMALRRTIEPGCATLLEPTDDRDDSAADFAAVFPSPRPNSVRPSEHACSAQAQPEGSSPAGGGGASTGQKQPQTQLRRTPPHRTHDRTPTFRFSASLAGSTYLCKLDRRTYRPCRSPFTSARLGFGHHLFQVKAGVPGGLSDPSPATYGFTVLKPKHN
jgi:hypothetical protein